MISEPLKEALDDRDKLITQLWEQLEKSQKDCKMKIEMEIEKVMDKLDQSHTELKRSQAELRFHQNRYKHSQEHKVIKEKIMMRNGVISLFSEDSTDNLETPKMIERQSTCEDKLSSKKCIRMKKKNEGNGCENKNTQKKCKATCGFCDDEPKDQCQKDGDCKSDPALSICDTSSTPKKCIGCKSAGDCPFGGTNYQCKENKCICPSPKVLKGTKCVENDESLLVQGRNQVDRTETNGAVILNNETKVKMAHLLNETFCNLTVTTEGEGTTCTTSIINFVVDQSTGDLFVDFVIIIKRSYMIEALN